ncbi:MAG: hypothetical protein IKS90_02000 [Clostridia bacterium]|nr:hypothetical protein [Clostridia bacterium]
MKTKLIKLTALFIVALMLFGAIACSAAINDPRKISIGKVGKAKLTLADFMGFYQNNYYAASAVPDYNAYIKEMTANYGVALNRCYELGLTLDEEENKELEERITASIDNAIASAGYASSEESREEQLKKLDKFLKQNGTSLKKYQKELKEDITKTMLLEKLRNQVASEVTCGKEDVKDYYNTNIIKVEEKYKEDLSAFSDDYNAYLTGEGMIPLTTPEDMFTVKQVLIQFENKAEVSDTVEGTFSEEQQKKIQEIRDALTAGISTQDFIDKYMLNADYNDDPVFKPVDTGDEPKTIENDPYLNLREHGYVMNEEFIKSYFAGFGEAACLLYYGKDWTEPTETPEPDATPAPDATEAPVTEVPTTEVPTTEAPATEAPATEAPATEAPEAELPPIEKYGIKFYTTTDGDEIAEVQTNVKNGGVHFIIIAEKLEAGRAMTGDDFDNEESEAFKSIQKFHLITLQDEHYAACAAEWKENAKIKMISDSKLAGYLQAYINGAGK